METPNIKANGPAYEKGEHRYGVPLDYVADKLSNAILALNALASARPELASELHQAMHYQLVAFLGLNNMLGAANDRELPVRILRGTHEDAERWIQLVLEQGDVMGVHQAN
ncbi:hypothetical protein GJ700_02600 [Duganella sp. FT92W]|uniref:Uncharacterized protein n=1 Tax=Pseudoduganella rivuli TaxID=2666085 RepID=A0A7X2IIE6_9BURK|nr:hypothetical protein [Pseudoduganella rivuli]MRV70609.1 hypothetical protein [Pseudoduganella rivuli]